MKYNIFTRNVEGATIYSENPWVHRGSIITDDPRTALITLYPPLQSELRMGGNFPTTHIPGLAFCMTDVYVTKLLYCAIFEP